MVLVLILSFQNIFVLAESNMDSIKIISYNTIECPTFGFIIVEEIDEYNRISRTFERGEGNQLGARTCVSSLQETKALLLALGMDEYFINRLSDEELNAFVTTPHININVSYSMVDALGNKTYIAPSMAYAYADAAREEVSPANFSFENGIQPMNTTSNGVMRLSHITSRASRYRDGVFWAGHNFITQTHWLVSPSFDRNVQDSIGSTAMNITPCTQVHSWLSYTMVRRIVDRNTGLDVSRSYLDYWRMLQGDTHRLINGSWQGMVLLFTLPEDVVILNSPWPHMSTVYQFFDFRISMTYFAYMQFQNIQQSFASIGAYYHNTRKFGLFIGSPTLSISPGSGVSASIGLRFSGANTTQTHSIINVFFVPGVGMFG